MAFYNKNLSHFTSNLWITFIIILVSAVVFFFGIYSEKELERAHKLRYKSYLLADEMRQTSDDLTRMVRAYVLTGNPLYKQYYKEILDIKNGIKPRPVNYNNIYWDLIISNGKHPHVNSTQTIALLTLMKNAGFTENEFSNLSLALTNSNILAEIEFKAINLIDKTQPTTEKNRNDALEILSNKEYHRAKYEIMKPINEFYIMIDKRTQDHIKQDAQTAFLIRSLFVLFGLLFTFMLWRIYRSLNMILGTSIYELHDYMRKIGSGDFTSILSVPKKASDSLLGWLSETQKELSLIEADRKSVEVALRKNQSHLDAIIQNEPECVKLVDPKGMLIKMNPAGLAMLEADSLEEAQEHGLVQFLYPEHRGGFLELHKKVMNGESGTYEFEIEGIKGGHRWLETNATPMRNEQGEVTMLLGITRDITDRRDAEVAMRTQSQAMEQSSNSIIITDAKAKITYVNNAFVKTTGYTPEEVLGKNPSFLNSGKTSTIAYKEMWNSISTGSSWQGEFINQSKDGKEYTYSINISPVLDISGNITHYIAIEEDITEQKQTISFAESCTGGRIAAAFTAISGASNVLNGSCITYSNEIKHKWLNVGNDILEEFGAVSEECVLQMLDGIQKMAQSDYAIAVSGIAVPTGGTEFNPVGSVYIGLLTPANKEIFHCRFKGNREEVQEQATSFAIEKLAKTLNF